MTTPDRPARSPIADAAAGALATWQQSEARRAEVIAKARTQLAPVLPGVPLAALQTTVEDDELVIVTDGVVTLGVRTDGTVWTVRRDRSVSGNVAVDRWVQQTQVRNARELAQALPPAVMQGRRGRG